MTYRFARAPQRQSGASLIEVLVAVLILSFGMLSLGAMLSFSAQAPKLSGYRSTAVILASELVERIRANPSAFAASNYTTALNYDGTFGAESSNDCVYPNCTKASIAAMDIAATKVSARNLLPAGGISVSCDAAGCAVPNAVGNLYIVWREPDKLSGVLTNTDICPSATLPNSPRCLYVRFSL